MHLPHRHAAFSLFVLALFALLFAIVPLGDVWQALSNLTLELLIALILISLVLVSLFVLG